MEFDFAPAAVGDLIRQYKGTLTFAGLDGSATMEMSEEVAEEAKESYTMGTPPLRDKQPAPPPSRAATPPLVMSGFKQDVFSLSEGDAVLRWPEDLSEDSYEDFKGWLELVLRKVARSVKLSRAAYLHVDRMEGGDGE